MNGDLFRSGFGPIMAPATPIEKRWRAFHLAHPYIGQELERRALQLRRAGAQRIGVKMLWESMRFDALVRSDDRPYAFNNDYAAIYSRWLIHNHPGLDDVIETRRRTEAVA